MRMPGAPAYEAVFRLDAQLSVDVAPEARPDGFETQLVATIEGDRRDAEASTVIAPFSSLRNETTFPLRTVT